MKANTKIRLDGGINLVEKGGVPNRIISGYLNSESLEAYEE